MAEFNGKDRRGTPRKEVHLPIKLFLEGDLIADGWALNINCYGVKLEIGLEAILRTIKNKDKMDQILSGKNIRVEIGGGVYKFPIKLPAKVKWSKSTCGEGEKIYYAGLELQLSEEQKKEWQQFFDKL